MDPTNASETSSKLVFWSKVVDGCRSRKTYVTDVPASCSDYDLKSLLFQNPALDNDHKDSEGQDCRNKTQCRPILVSDPSDFSLAMTSEQIRKWHNTLAGPYTYDALVAAKELQQCTTS